MRVSLIFRRYSQKKLSYSPSFLYSQLDVPLWYSKIIENSLAATIGSDRIRSVQKSATCRMAGAIQKSPHRPWGFRGNYLPRWMASAPFGCRVFEQRRRIPATPVVRALARHHHITSNKKTSKRLAGVCWLPWCFGCLSVCNRLIIHQEQGHRFVHLFASYPRKASSWKIIRFRHSRLRVWCEWPTHRLAIKASIHKWIIQTPSIFAYQKGNLLEILFCNCFV